MNSENRIISKLNKRLQSGFWKNAIVAFLTLVIVSIIAITGYHQFLQGFESVWVIIGCIGLFCLILIVAIISLIPFVKDIKLIKLGKIEKITGTVIKYRKVLHGGDPTTYSYYPIIRDISSDWIQVEVKADNTELNKTYRCIYLPNTKLAVCEELVNLNDDQSMKF